MTYEIVQVGPIYQVRNDEGRWMAEFRDLPAAVFYCWVLTSGNSPVAF